MAPTVPTIFRKLRTSIRVIAEVLFLVWIYKYLARVTVWRAPFVSIRNLPDFDEMFLCMRMGIVLVFERPQMLMKILSVKLALNARLTFFSKSIVKRECYAYMSDLHLL